MALITVNLTDTFDEWRVKTNLIAVQSFQMPNILEDTSPELGGNLDLNNFTINGPGTIASTVTLIGVPTTGFTIAMAVALG